MTSSSQSTNETHDDYKCGLFARSEPAPRASDKNFIILYFFFFPFYFEVKVEYITLHYTGNLKRYCVKLYERKIVSRNVHIFRRKCYRVRPRLQKFRLFDC